MTTKTKWIQVDVDLSEFTTDELIEEIEDRGVEFDSFKPQRVYEMFASGRDDEAIAECKKMIEHQTGRILP